ncbi:YdiK family protein [Thalassorhabdus alkalitolerans]|uniref:YdiK family protein n=1 Tax=Thalassorhabdus alkalitolerans TaxID=2282697 RepID=A0ABW0YNY2_9BACI|nr:MULTISPECIES: YdiK family protein [Bacillaceae]
MRFSPRFMGTMYIVIGIMFIVLAVQNVRENSWNVWTWFFAAIAAVDILVGLRFFGLKRADSKE